MTVGDEVACLADLIDQDVTVLRDLLVCPPAHFLEYTSSRKGKLRPVAEPDRLLKRVQRQILQRVLRQIPDHRASFCRSGRSIIDNARLHLKSGHVCVFDVADAFPSTSHALVERSLRRALAAHALPIVVARPITRLCTLHNGLPQGAPTSSALLDLVLRPIDDILSDTSRRRGACYSRYVDDITLFGGCAMPWAHGTVVRALDQVGLRLRHSKTKVWAPPRRATVTGIVLRDRPMLSADYIRRVKLLVGDLRADPGGQSASDVARIQGTLAYLGRLHPRLAKRLESSLRTLGLRRISGHRAH